MRAYRLTQKDDRETIETIEVQDPPLIFGGDPGHDQIIADLYQFADSIDRAMIKGELL